MANSTVHNIRTIRLLTVSHNRSIEQHIHIDLGASRRTGRSVMRSFSHDRSVRTLPDAISHRTPCNNKTETFVSLAIPVYYHSIDTGAFSMAAADKVLNLPELLENVLVNLPRLELTRVMRVGRSPPHFCSL